MKDFFKKLGAFLLSPPKWFALVSTVLAVISCGFALLIVAMGWSEEWWSYPVYAVAAISLTAFVFVCIDLAKKIKSGVVNVAGRYAFTERLMTDKGYRSKVFSTFGLIFSTAYSLFLGVMAFVGQSFWYASLAVYHLVFCTMRALVLSGEKKSEKRFADDKAGKQYAKVKTYTVCGWMLIGVGVALISSVLEIVFRGGGFKYAGMMIYVFAAMTFYKVTMSIVQIVKIKKQKDYTVRSIICGNLAWAAISLLSLQTAMFASFASGVENIDAFNALTGGGVILFLIALGVIVAVTGKKEQKRLEEENAGKSNE
ncbi:MAG: hypothetical protein IJX98_07470 [Clostridia bacterium]|nr:hypothetical protein [Clostridia bacterium]